MKVLLVYHNPGSEMVPAPPVGLAYVATATRHAGHRVDFLDLSHHPRPRRCLRRELRARGPEAVGFSIRNIDNVVRQRLEQHLPTHAALIEEVRRYAPIPVIVGGPAVSLLGSRSLAVLGADFAVVGEGERAFPELLRALEQDRSPKGLAGVVWSRDGSVRLELPERLPTFGSSHLEEWIDWRRYARRGHAWPIQSKRGCGQRCRYCCYPAIEGSSQRHRSAREVVDEIERVHRRVRPRTFELVDSTLNLPVGPLHELCDELRRRQLGVNLTAMGVSPRGCSQALFSALREAGFSSLMISAESASDPVLRSLRKGYGREQVLETARAARASGLWCGWFFLFGGPGENRETVLETLDFIERELDSPRFLSIAFTGIRLLPGAPLADEQPERSDPEVPRFYLSPEVDEGWILQRINETITRRPNLVHSAEADTSRWQGLLQRFAHLLGMRPPFWRLYPRYLRLPPIAYLRRQYPGVGAAA